MREMETRLQVTSDEEMCIRYYNLLALAPHNKKLFTQILFSKDSLINLNARAGEEMYMMKDTCIQS